MTSPSDAITNLEGRFVDRIHEDLAEATRVDIIVAFIMENGAKLIAGDLKILADSGVPIRILTGTYLGITEPSALYHLKRELGSGLEMRVFLGPGISFHPKAYLITKTSGRVVFVGSSNISLSAMTTGMEWNVRLAEPTSNREIETFGDTFEDLYRFHSEPATA